jgi:dTDP-4-amino-4,6-dideoxygalactose transaminase
LRIPDGKRDAFREFLSGKGIGSEIYYPLGLHQQECFQNIGRGGESLTVTPMLAKEVVSIPCFPELTNSEREEVLEAIWEFGYSQ